MYDFRCWHSGALATDGAVIYCFPTRANRVLAIDPIGEILATTTKANMEEHSEEFGSLFHTIIKEADEDSTLHVSLTNLDLTVIKFGYHSVFEILEEKCMKAMNDFCLESNLCPFFIVASYTDERHVCNQQPSASLGVIFLR